MCAQKSRHEIRKHRHWKMRHKVKGTAARPRLAVFKSLNHIYAQVIDDTKSHTLISVSSLEKVVKEHSDFKSKIALANFIGKLLGERAVGKGLKKVVFDKNGFLYHGRVKAVAEGAREAGLDF